MGLQDKLYVVGGYVDGWTPTNEVHEYDPASNRWRPLAVLPTPRGALAAAVLGGKIHAVGGVGWRGRNTPAREDYDPATNQWTALAGVPTARDHLAVAAVDGRLYALGGRVDGSYSRNLAANEAYDPAAGRWVERAPMPTARSGIAAAVLDKADLRRRGQRRRHLPSGGSLRAQQRQLERLRPHADGAPRFEHAAVAGKMYVISGGPTPGASVSAANEVFAP